MWRRLISLFLFAVVVGEAKSATIATLPLEAADTSLIAVTGPFEPGDAEQFRAKTASIPKAIVLLASDGGNLAAGLQIGEAIRLKSYTSVVPEGSRCASACALAWLGGTKRLMGKGAQIGFHSAFDTTTGAVSGAGDALIGAYLNKIGLPERAIVYMTSPAPSEIQWLSLDDAMKLGIDVEIFTLPTNPAPAPSSSPPVEPEPHRGPTETYSLTPDQLETASRLARNFNQRYKATGVDGLPESVELCYNQAIAKNKFMSMVYCVALDDLSSDFDKAVASQNKASQAYFFRIENVRARASAAISAGGMQDAASEISGLASAISHQAAIDLNEIAMQSPSP